MKSTYKPYRLINSTELGYLQKKISHRLETWNELYASEALRIELLCLPKAANKFKDQCLLKQGEQLLALFDADYLSIIKKTVFSNTANCFDAVCEEMFEELLKQLLGIEELELTKDTTAINDWFYPGSPCLSLRLSNLDSCLSIHLHPNWVLSQLAKPILAAKPLCKPDEACDEKELPCTVELAPVYLSLEQLSRLQPGDVLKTTHKLCSPLLLRYQQQQIAEVEAGQQLQQKSIQLRRSS